MNPVWHFVDGVPVIPVINTATLKFPTTQLSEGATDRLDLATGDSLYLVSGGLGVGTTPGLAGTVTTSAGITAGTFVYAEVSSAMGWGASRSLMKSPSDGKWSLTNNGSTSTISLDNGAAANGQAIGLVQTLTELTTIAAAATTDTTIQMPANSVVLGVSTRVTTVIPTAATFTVGDSGSAARFSTTTISTAANTTDPGTKAGAYYNASALSVRITPNLTPANNSGRVRVTIYYYTVTPPTS